MLNKTMALNQNFGNFGKVTNISLVLKSGLGVGVLQGLILYPLDLVSARSYKGLSIDHKLWRGLFAYTGYKVGKSSIGFLAFSAAGKLNDRFRNGKNLDLGLRSVIASSPLFAMNFVSVMKYHRQISDNNYSSILKNFSKRHYFAGVDGSILRYSIIGGGGLHIFGKLRDPEDPTWKTFLKGFVSFSLTSTLAIPIEAARQKSMRDPDLYPLAFKALKDTFKNPKRVFITMIPQAIKSIISGSLMTIGVNAVLREEESTK